MTDLETVARDATSGLRRAVDQFDAIEPGPRRTKRHRRLPAIAGLVVVALVGVLVVLVALTRTNEVHEPAGQRRSMWDKVSMRQAFGPETSMSGVIGTRWGFVAAGWVPHRCDPDVQKSACLTNRLWYSSTGRRWIEVSFPALRAAEGTVTLGQAGDRVLAVWDSSRGVGAAWSSNGREWHSSTIDEPGSGPEPASRFSSWEIGAWSGGVVASRLANRFESWVSPDGATWEYVGGTVSRTEQEFLFPQGVRIGSSWIGITGGLGQISNGASVGVPQIMESATGRGWLPIDSDAPVQLLPRLVPNATHQFAVAAQFRAEKQDVGLFRTRDGRTWTEIDSFRQQFPAANPSQIVHDRGWWLVSGTNGPGGAQSTAIWASKDLTHWSAAPQSVGRFGAPGMLATSRTIGIAIPRRGKWIRIVDLSAK